MSSWTSALIQTSLHSNVKVVELTIWTSSESGQVPSGSSSSHESDELSRREEGRSREGRKIKEMD